MATITTTPSLISPAYNPVNFVVNDGTPSLVGIRADININGAFAVSVDGVAQLGSTTDYDFDISEILQDYLTAELRQNPTTLQLTSATTSALEYTVDFFIITESGGVYSTNWAENGAGTPDVSSSSLYAYNGAVQEFETDTDYTQETLNKLALTNRPLSGTNIPVGIPFQVSFLTDITACRVQVIELDSTGSVVNTWNSAVTGAKATYRKFIAEIPTSVFADPSTVQITIQLEEETAPAVFAARSELYTFNVVKKCSGNWTLFWQGDKGGIDHYDFEADREIEDRSSRSTIKRDDNVSDPGGAVLSVNSVEQADLTAEAQNQATLDFLSYTVKVGNQVWRRRAADDFPKYLVRSEVANREAKENFLNLFPLKVKKARKYRIQDGD